MTEYERIRNNFNSIYSKILSNKDITCSGSSSCCCSCCCCSSSSAVVVGGISMRDMGASISTARGARTQRARDSQKSIKIKRLRRRDYILGCVPQMSKVHVIVKPPVGICIFESCGIKVPKKDYYCGSHSNIWPN